MSVCWGRRDVFWKIPLTSNVSSQWHCLYKKTLAPEGPGKSHYVCSRLTMRGALFLHVAMEHISLGIYTWYMRLENYDELRVDGHTEVVLPLLAEPYQLPVHLMVYHHNQREEGVECSLRRPHSPNEVSMKSTDSSTHIHKYGDHLTKFSFMVESSEEKSGTYHVWCQGKDYYRPESTWFPVTAKKEITLRFEHGIIIVL